jgi:DNA-binding transcriptional LysR family regulator
MKNLPFRWIETFRAVSRAGSMTDAARILNADQSAMSRHIAALESQLGITLFDRSKRRLRLTAEGKLLLAEADSAAEALNRLVRKANELRQVSEGHLQLLTSATLARGLMPKALSIFKATASGVSVNVDVVSRVELERRIEGQQFDLCAVALPFTYPSAHLVHIGSFPGVCVLHKRHKLAKMQRIDIADLAGETMVGLPQGTIGRMRIDQLFAEARIEYKPQFETTAVAVNEFVEHGIGIAITDPFTARSNSSGNVVIRPLKPTIHYDFAFLFPANRPRTTLASLFVEATADGLRV